MLAFLYKKNWFFLIVGAHIKVDPKFYRPEASRMLADASKAIQGIPILEGCSLTWDDAVMVDYSMQLAREENRGGEKVTCRQLKNLAKKAGVRHNKNMEKFKGSVKRKRLVVAQLEKVPNLVMSFRTRAHPDKVPRDILPEPYVAENHSRHDQR